MSGKRAFTLIELLLVLLLLGTVMTVILACFDGGFRVYARVSAFGTGELDVYLAGEMLERDLRNAIDAEGLPFRGDADGLEFAAVIHGPDGEGRPAAVRYRPAEAAGVWRKVEFLPSGGESSAELWLAGDYRLKLEYLDGGSAAGSSGHAPGLFLDRWPEGTNPPAAVRMEVSGGRLTEGIRVVRTTGVAAPGGGGRRP